jgi:N-acetylglucosaminyldiphosphoundecaprenol N-acetyl-beta-D-mannosaminyltransferase
MDEAKFSTVSIFGVPFSKMTMDETVRYLTDAVKSGKPHQVVTANPIIVMAALNDDAFMASMKQADLVVPDGTGIVWAANYVGNPVAERVAGFDLMHRLLAAGAPSGWKVYLLGTAPDVVEEAAGTLQRQYPGIRVVGYRDGFFEADQDDAVIAQIRATEPDLLFVARSTDKQDPWIGKYRHQLGVPLMMGVGGSLDIVAGRLKRAPMLFRKLRLEWFYRLLRQPSRYSRMLALPKFAAKVIREKENVQKY